MTDFIIPAEVIKKAQLDTTTLLVDLAVYLYDKERLSIGQARSLAQLDHIAFLREMGKRSVKIKFDEEDWEDDLVSLEKFSQMKSK